MSTRSLLKEWLAGILVMQIWIWVLVVLSIISIFSFGVMVLMSPLLTIWSKRHMIEARLVDGGGLVGYFKTVWTKLWKSG